MTEKKETNAQTTENEEVKTNPQGETAQQPEGQQEEKIDREQEDAFKKHPGYIKHNANVEKGIQQLNQQKKEAEKMNEEILESVFQVANEPEKLIEIHEQNPELAQKILTKMGITIEQYQVEKLGYDKPKIYSKQRSEEEIIAEYKHKQQKADMETRFDKRMNEIPLPAEQKEKIIEEYKDLVGDKPLSEEVQQKRFKAAYYTIVGEKYDSEEKIIKSQASLGTGNTSKGTKSKVLQDNTQYLRDCGYLKD